MTNIRTRLTHAGILALALALITAAAPAPRGNAATVSPSGAQRTTRIPTEVVNVSLFDDMHISLDRTSVPAGYVTFLVTNGGAGTHEFVVLRTDTPADALPANTELPSKALEDIHMGETGDMPAHVYSGLTLALGAGHYVVLCNEPGHYMAGMRADFTVTPTVIDVSLADNMSISLSQSVIFAGPVVFAVSNNGAITHELVILNTNAPADQIPADPDEIGKVSEQTNIGETGDIPAGRFSGIGITLGPGLYTVICNEPGHFMAGMHFQLLVLAYPGSDEPTQ